MDDDTADTNAEPLCKKARINIFNEKFCIFCHGKDNEEAFTSDNPAVTPNVNKLNTLFSACRQRNDEVGKTLIEHQSDIERKTISFRYHQGCRATYASPFHLAKFKKKKLSSGNGMTSAKFIF